MEKRLVRNVQDKKIGGVCEVLLTTLTWTQCQFVFFGSCSLQLVDQVYLLTLFFTSFFQKAEQKLKLHCN